MIVRISNSTRSDLKALKQRITQLKTIGRSAWQNLLTPLLASLNQSAYLLTQTSATMLIKCPMIWFTVLLIRYHHAKSLNLATYPLCTKVRDSIFLTLVAFLLDVWLVCVQFSFAERTNQLLTQRHPKSKAIYALLLMQRSLWSGAKRNNKRSTGIILVISLVSRRSQWKNYSLKTQHKLFTLL